MYLYCYNSFSFKQRIDFIISFIFIKKNNFVQIKYTECFYCTFLFYIYDFSNNKCKVIIINVNMYICVCMCTYVCYILYFDYMYKRIKCMWNKLLYLNFILYAVTLVAPLNKKIKSLNNSRKR